MTRVTTIPDEADTLCEGCGYVLNGLPEGGRCPECGKLTSESAAVLRQPPPWERRRPDGNAMGRFLRTSAACIFHPTAFFRSLSIQPYGARSRQFAHFHWAMDSVLFGSVAYAHLGTFSGRLYPWPILLLLVGLCFLFIAGLNELAARLTAWEAGYRGIRLPLWVVRRGLHYHAAHYLPPALLTAGVVWGYSIFFWRQPETAVLYGTTYLFTLCGMVLGIAFYLFRTYWIGMKNMMYANRTTDGSG